MKKIGFFLFFIGIFIFFAVLTTLVERSISMNLASKCYDIERQIEKKQQQISSLEILISNDLLTMSSYNAMSESLRYHDPDFDTEVQRYIGSKAEYDI